MDLTTAPLPTAVADYEVLHMLGEGGHGRCYLARPPARLGLDEPVVVLKVLADRVGEHAFTCGVRELRAVCAVGSPYVVRVFDAVWEDVVVYAMEHLPLGSLNDPGRPLARIEVLTALEHAARAAHDLHEAGIAHGGIRPGNVLLEETGGMLGGRLSDPGLARVLTPGAAVTGTGRVDALEFTDPALLAGAAPSRRSEVWALGATIHRALTGASLYGRPLGPQPLEAIRQVFSTRPQVRPGLEPAEGALVRACIAEDGVRLASAVDVADALAALRSLP
ncbi:protein kinase [Pseudonocardia sp. MH-G8]|uniref:protein kinase domain-containing protein n=1 Tax=Pseudonocardia sp. MH-G8 TaxID=1854588 RepID=UPI0018E9E16A|nr:protein kinase [Pseudonocardia sp. MH-G8]